LTLRLRFWQKGFGQVFARARRNQHLLKTAGNEFSKREIKEGQNNKRKIKLMKNRNIIFGAILSVLACLACLPQMKADPQVAPAPDGCYPGFTTAEGCLALQNLTTGAGNTGIGWRSLFLVSGGSFNTGVGAGTLVLNTNDNNTAVGAAALLLNTTGSDNTAVGTDALALNVSAFTNAAVGVFAAENNDSSGAGTAVFNTAVGGFALRANVGGTRNTAVGAGAIESGDGGNDNTAVGELAGNNITGNGNNCFGSSAGNTITTGANNVAVGNGAGNGIVTASNSIAIGGPAVGPFSNSSFTCWIYSIDGQPTSDIPSTVPVLIDSNNVLGTSASSRRFKHDIKPMDKASEAILALKPVTFKYNSDKTGTTLCGLIAEDVVKVNPNLVAYRDGKPYTVKYDQVNAMLLNEFLKAHKKVEEQQASIAELKSTVAQQQKGMEVLTAQLKEQAAQIQKVSAQLEVSKPAPQVVTNKP
jgi:hypothetical protein